MDPSRPFRPTVTLALLTLFALHLPQIGDLTGPVPVALATPPAPTLPATHHASTAVYAAPPPVETVVEGAVVPVVEVTPTPTPTAMPTAMPRAARTATTTVVSGDKESWMRSAGIPPAD